MLLGSLVYSLSRLTLLCIIYSDHFQILLIIPTVRWDLPIQYYKLMLILQFISGSYLIVQSPQYGVQHISWGVDSIHGTM